VVKIAQKNMRVVFLIILLSFIVYALITPGVCVAKLSASESGLNILRDFFGLDLDKYDVVVEENSLSEFFVVNGVQEDVLFTLTGDGAKLRIVFTFVNGDLRNMYVFENNGVPLLRQIGEDNGGGVVEAQVFLSKYEQYSAKSFFGELKASLDGVVVNKNYTKTVGNNVLEVMVYGNGETNFKWYYVVNGTMPLHANFVALGFKHGSLVSFTDTWNLYMENSNFELLKSAVPNTSEISVGLGDPSFEGVVPLFDEVEYFIVILFVVISMCCVFVAGLVLKNSLKRLYPLRGFSVKVFGVLLVFVVLLSLVGSVNALPVGVILGSRSSGASNDLYGYHSWRKTDVEISRQEYVNDFIMSNCLTVANGYAGFSNLWLNKSSVLAHAQYLGDNYDYVTVFDWDHGVGGYPGAVSPYLVPSDEIHYMFEDDWGTFNGVPSDYEIDWSHGVYDIDIYDVFAAGKVNFAFINTCLSADTELFGQGFSSSGYALGMPFAFTHRTVGYVVEGSNSTVMSDDGYNRPDAFSQCYIGFPFGSASLDQYIGYEYNWQPWYEWVVLFCYVAFNFDVSVNDAIDWTCSMQWGCSSFSVSPLQGEGFTAIWPVWDDTNKSFNAEVSNAQGLNSTLAVYGNGNIHLKNFHADHITTYPYINGSSSSDVSEVVNFSAYSVDSFGHNIRYVFDWGDGTTQTTNYTVAGVPVNVSHSWNFAGTYRVTVRAECENGAWSDQSEVYTITVGTYYKQISTIVITAIILSLIMLLIILWYRSKHENNCKNT